MLNSNQKEARGCFDLKLNISGFNNELMHKENFACSPRHISSKDRKEDRHLGEDLFRRFTQHIEEFIKSDKFPRHANYPIENTLIDEKLGYKVVERGLDFRFLTNDVYLTDVIKINNKPFIRVIKNKEANKAATEALYKGLYSGLEEEETVEDKIKKELARNNAVLMAEIQKLVGGTPTPDVPKEPKEEKTVPRDTYNESREFDFYTNVHFLAMLAEVYFIRVTSLGLLIAL